MKIASKIATAAFGFIAAVGLFTSCGDDGKKLYLYNWTYYTPDEVLRDFEKEFNCTVKVDSYASNEEMYAKLKAGAKGYDIVVPSQDYASIMIAQGMVQKLESAKQTNNSKINPLLSKMAVYDPKFEYASPYYLGAAGVCVNKTKIKEGSYEKTWNIFADKKFAGHATMMDDMREVIGDALTVLGYDLNTLDDNELAQAKNLIVERWKPNLVKFDAEGFGKSFASG
ncbi:extracellular solute-binding protein, partial [Treponema pectinovorum]